MGFAVVTERQPNMCSSHDLKERLDWRQCLSRMAPERSGANGGSLSAMELCLCEADGLIRQLEPDDWRRLRDARLRALASDPDAFLVTLDEARKYPDERWRERAAQTESNVTFVYERADGFDAMVGAFSRDDAESVYLVGMWVASDLRGSGVARQLVERVVAWARGRGCSRVVLSVRATTVAPHASMRSVASRNSSNRRHFPTSRVLATVSTPTHCDGLVADGGPRVEILDCTRVPQ